jgi:hypothetical protein
MEFLQFPFRAAGGDAVRVDLDRHANVRLMDASNFGAFRRGVEHRAYGGRALRSPCVLPIPHSGNWVVVVDLGGQRGSVRAAVNVVRR